MDEEGVCCSTWDAAFWRSTEFVNTVDQQVGARFLPDSVTADTFMPGILGARMGTRVAEARLNDLIWDITTYIHIGEIPTAAQTRNIWAKLVNCHHITRFMDPERLADIWRACVARDTVLTPQMDIPQSMELRRQRFGDSAVAVAAHCVVNPGVTDFLDGVYARGMREGLWAEHPGIVAATALGRSDRGITARLLRFFGAPEAASYVAAGAGEVSFVERHDLEMHGRRGTPLPWTFDAASSPRIRRLT